MSVFESSRLSDSTGGQPTLIEHPFEAYDLSICANIRYSPATRSLVPEQYSANPKLGRWVSTQRAQYKLFQEGKPILMKEERIRELESI